MARRKQQDQLALFDLGPQSEPEPAGVGAARQPEEVEALGRELPREIHLGGSTWSFPGWAGTARTHRPAWLARDSRPTPNIRSSVAWGSTARTTRRSRRWSSPRTG